MDKPREVLLQMFVRLFLHLSYLLQSIFPGNGGVINFATWFGFAFPNMVLMLVLTWFWLQFMFLGLK